MKTTVADLYRYIDGIAPFASQVSWDNSGLNVGTAEKECKCVLVALDITAETVAEAASVGADLIISHHPVIFDPLKSVSDRDAVYRLCRADIGALCCHTNWDQAAGGVSDVLFDIISQGAGKTALTAEDGTRFVRAGELKEEVSLRDFSVRIKKELDAACVRYFSVSRPVKRVAVCGGAGGSELDLCASWGADTVVTGEAKYHEMLQARELGINLVLAGHYETEFPAMRKLCGLLEKNFDGVRFVLSATRVEEQGL